jgi:hypothetical protein
MSDWFPDALNWVAARQVFPCLAGRSRFPALTFRLPSTWAATDGRWTTRSTSLRSTLAKLAGTDSYFLKGTMDQLMCSVICRGYQ